MKNFLSELNESQKEAVVTTEGPLMVIAGAGSGKTRVLTYRIAYLIQKSVNPFTILSLTFTNKAAQEMKERVAKLVGDSQARNIWMGTFHSIFVRILREEAEKIRFPSNFTIYDSQDSLNVLKKVITELNLDIEIYKPKKLQSRISEYKNNLITVSSYFQSPKLMESDTISRKPQTGEIYRRYSEKCFENGAMDFDDLLLKTNEMFTMFPEVLLKYQNRFRYILVDEYQDTNHSQYLIIKALASRFKNLCVVGDDAQSIYGFRGANISNILNFKCHYTDAKIITLEQNYRSTQIVVKAANSIIAHNKEQLDKNIWTSNPKGEKISVYRAFSDTDEANFIVNSIFELKSKNHLQNKEFAIFYRTNAQSRSLEDALRKKKIPYKVYGGMSFYQRREIKDLLAYLRILINPNDEEALLRIINFPPRGIGNSTINKLIVASNEKKIPIYEILETIIFIGESVGLNQGVVSKLNQFWKLIESFKIQLKTSEVYEVAMQISIQSGLIKHLKKDNTSESISKIENINELISSIQSFIEEQKKLGEGIPTLGFFMENITLANNIHDKEDFDNDRVSLMTVHLAKGLEFPYVYIAGVEEELFPSAMSLTQETLEEERRLFYVALTRAEKQIFISFATTRFRWGKICDNNPSRFLEEINDSYLNYLNPMKQRVKFNNSLLNDDLFKEFPIMQLRQELRKNTNLVNKKFNPIKKLKLFSKSISNEHSSMNLKIGNKVLHERFGKGTILSVDKNVEHEKVTIYFDNCGQKKLLLKFAKLVIV